MKTLNCINTISKIIITILFVSACNDKATKENHVSLEEIKISYWTWASENLNITNFRNGDSIPEAKNSEEWKEASKHQKPAWCYYANDPENGNKYGKLYNWYAVNDSRGLAPDGWHIPSDVEWDDLIHYLGGAEIAGGKMKSANGWQQSQWDPPGTNNSGFSAVAGGCRGFDGNFGTLGLVEMQIGKVGIWWTATSAYKYAAVYHNMLYDGDIVNKNIYNKGAGFSVRCMKDLPEDPANASPE